MARGRISIPIHVRYAVIKRDKCTCHYCGKKGEFVMRYDKPAVVENPYGIDLANKEFYNGPDVVSFHFDHITPVSAGGQNNEDNVALSCQHCNESKGAKNG